MIKRHFYKNNQADVWFRYIRNLMTGAEIVRCVSSTEVRTKNDEQKIIAKWDHRGFGFIHEHREYNIAGERATSGAGK